MALAHARPRGRRPPPDAHRAHGQHRPVPPRSWPRSDVPPTGSLDDFLAVLLGAAVRGGRGSRWCWTGIERVRSADALRTSTRSRRWAGRRSAWWWPRASTRRWGSQRRRLAGDLFEVRAARPGVRSRRGRPRLLAGPGWRSTPVNRALLLQRTEGWPAALALATMALRGHPRPDEFVRTFSGNDRAVSDYLTSEVLTGLDPAAAELLVCTSIVDPVSEDLAAAVLDDPAGRPAAGRAGPQRRHRLQRRRARPLVPLPPAAGRGAADRAAPAPARRGGRAAPPRGRAGSRRAGMVPEAVRQAVAAEDWDLVARPAGRPLAHARGPRGGGQPARGDARDPRRRAVAGTPRSPWPPRAWRSTPATWRPAPGCWSASAELGGAAAGRTGARGSSARCPRSWSTRSARRGGPAAGAVRSRAMPGWTTRSARWR